MNRLSQIAVVAVVIVAGISAARAADVHAQMAELFAAGEKNTPPSVASARQIAITVKRAHLQDLRIDYAFGLVLTNQRRYSDALPLLARYLAANPRDLLAHRVKLWTEMQSGEFAAARKSMAALAAILATQTDNDPSTDGLDSAKLLGACIVYLERIRPDTIDHFGAFAQSLASQFPASYRSALDEGRRELGAKLDELLAAQANRLKSEQLAAAEVERQVTLDLENVAEQISSQREMAESSLDKARDSQRELQNIRQQYARLLQDRTRLSAQIITLQAQLTSLQEPLTAVQGANSTVNNGNLRAYVGLPAAAQMDRLAQLQAVSVALAALNKQAFDMDRLILSLQQRGAELAGTSQVEFKKVAESAAAAEKAAKKVERLNKQLERQEAESLTRPPRLTGRMTRFSTYAPLPYEEESQRVLGWFAN